MFWSKLCFTILLQIAFNWRMYIHVPTQKLTVWGPTFVCANQVKKFSILSAIVTTQNSYSTLLLVLLLGNLLGFKHFWHMLRFLGRHRPGRGRYRAGYVCRSRLVRHRSLDRNALFFWSTNPLGDVDRCVGHTYGMANHFLYNTNIYHVTRVLYEWKWIMYNQANIYTICKQL